MKISIYAALIVGLGFATVTDTATAATRVSVNCVAPTTRVSGLLLPPSEIKDYSFWYQQPTATEIGPVKQPSCSYTVPIAEGVCIKAGTVFSASVTDTGGLESDRATVTLTKEECNPKTRPSAPTVTLTVQ